VTDGGTPTAPPGALATSEIHADADGRDGENLNDEYVVFENTGTEAIDLSGWTISDAVGKTYTIPEGVVLEAGAIVMLHTGSGTDTESDLYWGASSPVWNNGGDTVVVTNSEGDVVLDEAY
jgi:competence protein ComEC